MANIAEIVQDLQRERDFLNQAIAALTPLATKNGAGRALNRMGGAGRTLSAAARRKIAAAQRKRWAKFHAGASAAAQNSGAPKVKRVLSAAARRKIAAAQRARWAKFRQGQKKAA